MGRGTCIRNLGIGDDVPQEFYDSPPPQGYFYRPSNVQAKTFDIKKKEPPMDLFHGELLQRKVQDF
jgi:hypothetical protein